MKEYVLLTGSAHVAQHATLASGWSHVQGKEENLRESARYRPACFVSDGSHRREM